MSKSKQIGTACETAVVKALRKHGFPHAERRALAGTHDLGDITGTPGIVWEVKGGEQAKTASDGQVEDWLRETETERLNARADIGVLVMQRRGIGPTNAHRWWAVLMHEFNDGSRAVTLPIRMPLEDACSLLRFLGYGGYPLRDAA